MRCIPWEFSSRYRKLIRQHWTIQADGLPLSSLLLLSLSSVFCCRAGSGYLNGYPVLGNSRGGFPLPSSRFIYCDQSFPSPWHCLSAAGTLPIWCYPLVHSRGHSPIRNLGMRVVAVVPQPSANLSHQQTHPIVTYDLLTVRKLSYISATLQCICVGIACWKNS